MKKTYISVVMFFLILSLLNPIVSSNNEGCGLSITDIYVTREILQPDKICFNVRNIDDVAHSHITYRVVVEKLLIKSVAIRTLEDYTFSTNFDSISPGESVDFEIRWPANIRGWDWPKLIIPGFYMVRVNLFPENPISGYDDENRYEKFFGFGFINAKWFQAY